MSTYSLEWDNTESPIILNKVGHCAVLTLNHPPAHTWTYESLQHLTAIVTALNQDRDIWSLIMTGAGQKFFSAGADLKLFASGDKQVARQMARVFGVAFECLSQFRGVSIAAINGYAMGGGLEAALACDIRIAETHAVMGLPEAKVGLLPCAGGTQNLTRLVGEGWAKRMILCGETLNAEQAMKIHLVEQVVETGQGLSRAIALAESVAQQSPCSVAACKQLIQLGRQSTQAGYMAEREYFVDLFDTADQAEGVNAFLQKRAPIWKNG